MNLFQIKKRVIQLIQALQEHTGGTYNDQKTIDRIKNGLDVDLNEEIYFLNETASKLFLKSQDAFYNSFMKSCGRTQYHLNAIQIEYIQKMERGESC